MTGLGEPDPLPDGAQHIAAELCPCRPTCIPVELADGGIRYVFAHHDSDGTPEDEADRAATIAEAIEMVRAGDA